MKSEGLKIVIITQEEPLFLRDALDYLMRRLPQNVSVVGAVVLGTSPFGKKESWSSRVIKTFTTFGLKFFVVYALAYAYRIITQKTVKKMLDSNAVPIIDVGVSINSVDALSNLAEVKPDLLVSIASNQIFKRPLIELPKFGILNLHTALLPKYRGLMPTFWALHNQEKETGVSVFFVDEGIDTGPILVQKKFSLEPPPPQWSLIRQTKYLGMEAINEALENILINNVATGDNLDEDATYVKFPSRSDVREFVSRGGRFF